MMTSSKNERIPSLALSNVKGTFIFWTHFQGEAGPCPCTSRASDKVQRDKNNRRKERHKTDERMDKMRELNETKTNISRLHYVFICSQREDLVNVVSRRRNFLADLVVGSGTAEASDLGMLECARNPLSKFLSHTSITSNVRAKQFRMQLCLLSSTTSR